MAEKQLKILTVRPSSDEEREAIRYVMKQTGHRRAAQAMLFACTAYQIANERNRTYVDEIKQKYIEQQRQQQRVINSLMAENEKLRKSLKLIQEGLGNMNDLMQEALNNVSIPPEQGTTK